MVIIPSDRLTLSAMAAFRNTAIELGKERAVARAIAPYEKLRYRNAQNILDFGTVGREQWLTATLAVVNTPYSVWTTLAAPLVGLTPTLANNRVAVFYSAAVLTVPNPVSLLTFWLGVGTTLAVFDLEQIEAQVTAEGYFTKPVIYDPQDILQVTVTSKIATGAQAAVVLGCYIIEPVGTTQQL